MAQPRSVVKAKVQPRAGSNEILGFRGDVLKVKVTAPPEGGKANEALVDLLASSLRIAKSRIRVLGGHTSRDKWISIDDLSVEDLRCQLKGG